MYRDRLIEIVNFAYARLREKINGGRICVENEASLQLHLSSLLKSIGELYESSKNERFSIELEKPVVLSDGRFENKSGTPKAKIDVWISLENLETNTRTKCAIELKYFKLANHREPNNRYDVFSDILNLENYGEFTDIGFLIVATDHNHYVEKSGYSEGTKLFDFRHGESYSAGTPLSYNTGKPYGGQIILANSYNFNWDKSDKGFHFLILRVDPSISPQEKL